MKVRIWHRSADRVILAEVRKTYGAVPVGPRDVVLDVGAHIGAASLFLLEKGAAKVVAVEPDPANISFLRRNLPRQTILWAAVGPKLGRTTLYAAGSHLSTTVEGDGRRQVEVPMVTLEGLLAQFRPTIVKIDTEFGEYAMPELLALPDFVRVVALEVHVRLDLVYRNATESITDMRRRRKAAAELMAAIEAQGFVSLYRKEKQAKDAPIEDSTGLDPYCRSVDGVWAR